MIVKQRGFRKIDHRLTKTIRDMKPLLEARLLSIGRIVLREIQSNLSNKILHKRTGKLYNSWNFRTTAENFGYRLSVGSYSVYAAIHDLGGRTGRNHATKIPARRYARKAFTAKKAAIRRHMEGLIGIWVK